MSETKNRPLAFVHLMKTGGQTIRAVLRKNFGTGHCDTLLEDSALPRDWRWIKTCYPRLKSVCGHCVVPFDETIEEFFPGTRYFTILRDPVKRSISHYQFNANSGSQLPPFEDWVQENANYFTRRIAGEVNVDKAIEILENKIGFTGFVEHYDESILMWKRWVGLPDLDVGYRIENKAVSNSLQKDINSEVTFKDLLESCHTEDRKLFDYALGTIFERQRDEYGSGLLTDLEEFESRQQEIATNKNLKTTLSRLKRNCIYRVGVRKV